MGDMMKHLSLGLGLVCLLGGAGCKETVDSTDVRTSGIYAKYQAISNGDTTQLTARLLVGGDESNTDMRLTESDRLRGTVADESKTLTDDNNNQMYEALFDETAGGTDVQISFTRGDEDDDAPDSTAILPEGFTLGGVADDESISRMDDIVITWDPSGDDDDMEWNLEGDCISTEFDLSQADTGTVTIAAGRVEPKFEDDADQTCDVTFTLDRVRPGSVDPHFNDDSDGPGEFDAIQRRRLTFRSAP
jgi:hypothetical protein